MLRRLGSSVESRGQGKTTPGVKLTVEAYLFIFTVEIRSYPHQTAPEGTEVHNA